MPLLLNSAARTQARARAQEKAAEAAKGKTAGKVAGVACASDGASERPSASSPGETQRDSLGKTQRETFRNLTGGRMTTVASLNPKEELPINDWRFHWFIYGAILLNAIQMGLQVDINGGAVDTVWLICSNIFTFIFALEMILKLWFLRCAYFKDRWNILDCLIAWLGIIDTWVLPCFIASDTGLLPFQLLRLVRMVKLLRMRRELMALISGLIGSLRCMLWIGILLGVTVYTFGIFCSQVVGTADYSDTTFDNRHYFGSLPRSMLTLFNICILDSWSSIIYPLYEVQTYLTPLFVVFLVLTSFGLLNALIGVIVEQTTLATQEMEAATAREERENKMQIVESLVQMVMDIDKDSDGCISATEMKAAEEIEELRDVMKSIDLPPGFSLGDLHTMLDQDGSGELDKDEFIGGMYRLIFCNDFQYQCMAQLSMAQMKKAILCVQNELRHDMQETCARLKDDFEAMLMKHLPVAKEAPAAKLLQAPQLRSNGSIFDVKDDGQAPGVKVEDLNPDRISVQVSDDSTSAGYVQERKNSVTSQSAKKVFAARATAKASKQRRQVRRGKGEAGATDATDTRRPAKTGRPPPGGRGPLGGASSAPLRGGEQEQDLAPEASLAPAPTNEAASPSGSSSEEQFDPMSAKRDDVPAQARQLAARRAAAEVGLEVGLTEPDAMRVPDESPQQQGGAKKRWVSITTAAPDHSEQAALDHSEQAHIDTTAEGLADFGLIAQGGQSIVDGADIVSSAAGVPSPGGSAPETEEPEMKPRYLAT